MATAQQARPSAPMASPVGLVAALDVGVSKTVCLAARRDPILDMHPDRPMRVLGVGLQSAPAIASGKAADFDACARAIRVAIDEASFMAGSPLTRVMASYGGPGVGSQVARATIKLKNARISERDLEAVLNVAANAVSGAGRAVLHVEPLRYFIDDGDAMPDPVGKPGATLGVEACIVSAPADAIKALRACVRMAGAEIEDIIPAPFASGLSALTDEERDGGALMLDLGAGGVGIAAFAAEGLVYCETMPSCGVRLTRDLAVKLETSYAAAERVKLTYGAVGGGFDPREPVQAPKFGADGRLEAAVTLRGVIADSMTPRLHGLFMQVRDRLAKAGVVGQALPKRCVLVGGVSQLPGLRELAGDALGMPVRVGRPFDLCGFDSGETGPGYATGAGLLRWRMDHPELADVEESFQPSLAGAAHAMRSATTRAWDWLRDNF